jgi:hypothetical protein
MNGRRVRPSARVTGPGAKPLSTATSCGPRVSRSSSAGQYASLACLAFPEERDDAMTAKVVILPT